MAQVRILVALLLVTSMCICMVDALQETSLPAPLSSPPPPPFSSPPPPPAPLSSPPSPPAPLSSPPSPPAPLSFPPPPPAPLSSPPPPPAPLSSPPPPPAPLSSPPPPPAPRSSPPPPPAPHSSPPPPPRSPPPPPPRCPPCPFPFVEVRPLKVSSDKGIDATITVRYVDKVLKKAGPYQLPSKGKVLSLTQQFRVTTVQSFYVDFVIKRGYQKVYLSATVNLWLAKKVAVPTAKKTTCGDPIYCIELRLVIRTWRGVKQYEVYSGTTLVAKKKY